MQFSTDVSPSILKHSFLKKKLFYLFICVCVSVFACRCVVGGGGGGDACTCLHAEARRGLWIAQSWLQVFVDAWLVTQVLGA